MSVMAGELGLTREADVKDYITVTLALLDGHPNDGNFNFCRTDRRANSDYNVELMIHKLRKKIKRTKKGREMLRELKTEAYAIPVPERGHRVFSLPSLNKGYKWILEKINDGGGRSERLG